MDDYHTINKYFNYIFFLYIYIYSMTNYKQKYLKYKLKYLNLKKNKFTGGTEGAEPAEPVSLPDSPLAIPYIPQYSLTGCHLLMMMTMDKTSEQFDNKFLAYLSNIIGFYLFTSIADDTTHMYMPRNFTQFKMRKQAEHIQNYQNYFNEVLQQLHKEKMKAMASTTAVVEGKEAVVEGKEAVVETPAYEKRNLTENEKEIIMLIINDFIKYIDEIVTAHGHVAPSLVVEFNKNTQIKVDVLIAKQLKDKYTKEYEKYFEKYIKLYNDGTVEPTQHNKTDASFDEYLRMRIDNMYSGV